MARRQLRGTGERSRLLAVRLPAHRLSRPSNNSRSIVREAGLPPCGLPGRVENRNSDCVRRPRRQSRIPSVPGPCLPDDLRPRSAGTVTSAHCARSRGSPGPFPVAAARPAPPIPTTALFEDTSCFQWRANGLQRFYYAQKLESSSDLQHSESCATVGLVLGVGSSGGVRQKTNSFWRFLNNVLRAAA